MMIDTMELLEELVIKAQPDVLHMVYVKHSDGTSFRQRGILQVKFVRGPAVHRYRGNLHIYGDRVEGFCAAQSYTPGFLFAPLFGEGRTKYLFTNYWEALGCHTRWLELWNNRDDHR